MHLKDSAKSIIIPTVIGAKRAASGNGAKTIIKTFLVLNFFLFTTNKKNKTKTDTMRLLITANIISEK